MGGGEEVVLGPAWLGVGGMGGEVGEEVQGSRGLAVGWAPWRQGQDEA